MKRWILVLGLTMMGSVGCGKKTPGENRPTSGAPAPVQAYLDSLRQSEDSLSVRLFETLVKEGLGEVLFYRLFMDTVLRDFADSVLSPDLRDSLHAFLSSPPPENLQAAYVVVVDSIWDALLHPPAPEQPLYDTLDYDKMITPDRLPFPYNILKKLGLLRFGKEIEKIGKSTSSACFRMNHSQYTRLRSTVGTVVSCVEYGVDRQIFSPHPGVYKRVRNGELELEETRLTILKVAPPESPFPITSCAEEGRGCAGWVRILDRWMTPNQFHPPQPPEIGLHPSSVTRVPKLHPLAILCAALGGGLSGVACEVFRELRDVQIPHEDIEIYTYRASGISMPSMIDTVDFYPGDPVVDELHLTWQIHLYRPPDISDWVIHCDEHKQFRVPGGPTDPTRSLECAALKEKGDMNSGR